MAKVLIWQFHDGSIALRVLDERMRLADEADAAFAERIRAKTALPRLTPRDGIEASNFAAYEARMETLPNKGYAVFACVVDQGALPTDRSFRNAWKADMTHDMERCRHIHRERMRAVRAPKLAALDAEYQRADEGGDTEKKQAIAARKQALRDVTKHPDIEAVKTPEQLKAVWPKELS